MKRGEMCFQKNYEKILTSKCRARVAKGRPAFRDCITRGNLEFKILYRGVGADFEKPKIYFRLTMTW